MIVAYLIAQKQSLLIAEPEWDEELQKYGVPKDWAEVHGVMITPLSPRLLRSIATQAIHALADVVEERHHLGRD
jgi:hypothetical protein